MQKANFMPAADAAPMVGLDWQASTSPHTQLAASQAVVLHETLAPQALTMEAPSLASWLAPAVSGLTLALLAGFALALLFRRRRLVAA